MYEIRFHGRGGQGAVTSAELVAQAAIAEGKYGQAFPSFGPERRGAPVMAYARVADKQIRNRSAIHNPDCVLVLDASLLSLVNVADGLAEGGVVAVATGRPAKEVQKELGIKCRVAVVDALTIALDTIRRPITNTTMLGVLVKATGAVKQEYLEEAIRNRFGPIAPRNVVAMKRAVEQTEVFEG